MTETPSPPEYGESCGIARAAVLAAAGLLAGVLGVSAIQAVSGSAPSVTPASNAVLPQVDIGAGDDGFAGEQRLVGTLTAVGSSSVTVQTEQGTSTYAVSSSTDVERDGLPVALSSLKRGDVVLVHLLPSGSGCVAERVLAGASSGRST